MKLPLAAWVLVDKDDNVQGMDANSGGYQYNASGLGDIRYWPTEEAAIEYRDIIDSKHDKGYKVISVFMLNDYISEK